MRALFVCILLALILPAYADESYGSLDFSRLSASQADVFWRRLQSLAIEEAVLAHCGQRDDFEQRASAGIRACVSKPALDKATAYFHTELQRAQASLRARKASCAGKAEPQRGWLGVEIEGGEKGARVKAATPGSPAAAADLKPGDLIVAVNGEAVTGPKELIARIRALAPGASVSLALMRDGAERKASVKLGGMAFDASGQAALDMPALIAASREDLAKVADEVTDMCGKCKSSVWALFCR